MPEADHKLVEAIAALCRAAERPRILPARQEPDHVYLLVEGDGSVKRIEAPPRPRRTECLSLDAFCDGVRQLKTDATRIYIGCDCVVAVLEDSGRRLDQLTMHLTPTRQFATLTACERSRQSFGHKAFMRMLRVDLHEAIDRDLVALFGSLRFSKTDDGQSKITPGEHTLGRKVMQKIAGFDNELPDTISLHCAAYNELVDYPWATVQIDAIVDLEIDEATFTLIPKAGQIAEAMRVTRREILASIENSSLGVPVLIANP